MTENGLIGVLIPRVLYPAVTVPIQGTGVVYFTIPEPLIEQHASVRTPQRNLAIPDNARVS
ncbi:hypothetical protein ACJMK2_015709 [Sinanodonta woodiana]|uniref:Uncharacterized protein n=1 Tax=Sinanodonta woodiana TaxID=1069815 RepID=A0ABD3URI1_SINWO